MAVEKEVTLRLNVKPPQAGSLKPLTDEAKSLAQYFKTFGEMPLKPLSQLKLPQQPVLDVLPARKEEERYREAVNNLNQDLDRQRKHLDQLNVAMDPKMIRQRVAAQLELEKTQKRYSEAMERERYRQTRGQGGITPGGAQSLGALQGIASMFGGGMGGGISRVAGLFGNMGGGGGGAGVAVAGPVGALAAGAVMAGKAILDLGKSAISASIELGAIASPAARMQFDMAYKDIQAIIGRRLVPVMNLATEGLKAFGEILTNLLPSQSQMRDVVDPLKQALKDMLEAVKPLVLTLKDLLASGLLLFAESLRIALRPIKLIGQLLSLGWAVGLGYGSAKGADWKERERAPTQANWVNNPEELGKQLAVASLGMSAVDYDKVTADSTKSAAEELKGISQKVQSIIDALKVGGNAVSTGITNAPKAAMEVAQNPGYAVGYLIGKAVGW